MQLPLQNFGTLVQTMAAGVQAASRQLLDLTVGSVLRAVLESNASLALWMQWLILQVLQTTRASTSLAADLDSWVADFGVARLPAVASAGLVTFSRFTPLAPSFIPVGTLVRTADGTQTFAVVADGASPAFSAVQNGYSIAANVPSVDLPVRATAAGAGGNVLAGSVTLLATAIPGVDSVINGQPLGNGLDAESDAALRGRFASFLDSRSRAAPIAIGYAVDSIQQGLGYVLVENRDASGAWRPGNFIVVLDDGSGYPSASLLAAAAAAVENVRPVGTSYSVQPPTVVVAAISLVVDVRSTAPKALVVSAASDAISLFVNALPIGAPLAITRIAQLAYSANPSVVNVFSITINGEPADLVPSPTSVVKAGPITIG